MKRRFRAHQLQRIWIEREKKKKKDSSGEVQRISKKEGAILWSFKIKKK